VPPLRDETREGDWMRELQQANALGRIPPEKLQAACARMQRLPCRAGDVIVRQGEPGDFFYVLVSGRALVTRETPLSREGIKLAELGPGETFGEEALICEGARNATVRMLTDGVLMRLPRQDFRELMCASMLRWVNHAEARTLIARGGRWLDVRLPSEHQNLCIEGSLNIPLYFVRLKLGALVRGVPYVVYCDTGRRSAAAAYILAERGFDTFVLRDGLMSASSALRRPA
jgi:rhodanese-related sulfurtransferase